MNKIIRASLDNIEDLIPLFDAYRVFYRKESNVEQAKRFLTSRIKENESIVFMFYKNNIAVGFTQLYPVFSSVNMALIWLLNDLFVLPKYRGHKIGKQLIVKVQQYCKDTYAKGVSLETEQSNIVGNILYPKMGFNKDEEHNFYYWENSNFSF